jgi:glycosyltransferase involved in cell wall biosynthesis
MTVGVVIPAYNSARVLAEAIESVLSQEPPADRLIVVDDGSTDDTPPVLEKYRGHLEYVRQPNRGPSAARNRGWGQLHTDAVVFLDADDTLLPGGLAVRRSVLADGKVVWGYTDGFLEDSSGRRRRFSDSYPPGLPRGGGHLLPDLLCRNFISMSGTILRRDILESMGGFDESMRWMEDWDLWLRLAVRYPAGYGSQPTFVQRKRPGTLSSDREAMTKMRFHILVKIHRLFPVAVEGAGRPACRSVADAHNQFGYALAAAGRWPEARPFLGASVRLWRWQRRAWWLLFRSAVAPAGGTRASGSPTHEPGPRPPGYGGGEA